jgi:hypothetical protein
VLVTAGVRDKPETMRVFRVAHWQLKQCEDVLITMKVNGRHFVLSVHGDSLLSHLLNVLGECDLDDVVMEPNT